MGKAGWHHTAFYNTDMTRRLAFAAIQSIASLYAGALTLRLLARTFPLRADLRPRKAIVALRMAAMAICFAPLAIAAETTLCFNTSAP